VPRWKREREREREREGGERARYIRILMYDVTGPERYFFGCTLRLHSVALLAPTFFTDAIGGAPGKIFTSSGAAAERRWWGGGGVRGRRRG